MISASMELVTELVNNQLSLCIPVALVLIGAILVFTFGFKSAEQPPFDKLSSNISDDRKPAGKKRKTKEKKPTVNGHVANTSEAKTDKSPKRPTKDAAENQSKSENQAKSQADKKIKEQVKNKKVDRPEEIKIKKSTKAKNEKPADFDDGSWETVPTKGDKKKKQESPVKKDRKYKKVESFIAVEKQEQNVSPDPSEIDKVTEVAVAPATEKEDAFLDFEIVENQKESAENEVKEDVEESDLEIPQPVEVDEETAAAPVPPAENSEEPQEGAVAFDELGDVWTEAKVVKKSKKKSRREI